jgi:hypothetical protein
VSDDRRAAEAAAWLAALLNAVIEAVQGWAGRPDA